LLTIFVNRYLFLLFANKFIVEEFISSGPLLTKQRFGWGVQSVGMLGAIIGLLVVPISVTVGRLSKKVNLLTERGVRHPQGQPHSIFEHP